MTVTKHNKKYVKKYAEIKKNTVLIWSHLPDDILIGVEKRAGFRKIS
jgi:hypothetical protein